MSEDELDDQSFKRILREEAMVTDGELRLEVAHTFERSVYGDEDVLLNSSFFKSRSSYQITRDSRTTTVNSSYERETDKADMFRLKGSLTEVVHGAIMHKAELEAEHIVGMVYSGTWAGPYMRIAAYTDFLSWGGWADVDVTRIQIAGLAITAYMGYAQVIGLRLINNTSLIDDWQLRTENYGIFIDNQSEAVLLGGPGSQMSLNT